MSAIITKNRPSEVKQQGSGSFSAENFMLLVLQLLYDASLGINKKILFY